MIRVLCVCWVCTRGVAWFFAVPPCVYLSCAVHRNLSCAAAFGGPRLPCLSPVPWDADRAKLLLLLLLSIGYALRRELGVHVRVRHSVFLDIKAPRGNGRTGDVVTCCASSTKHMVMLTLTIRDGCCSTTPLLSTHVSRGEKHPPARQSGRQPRNWEDLFLRKSHVQDIRYRLHDGSGRRMFGCWCFLTSRGMRAWESHKNLSIFCCKKQNRVGGVKTIRERA